MPRPELFPVKKAVGFDWNMMVAIDTWRAKQKPLPNVSEAIRRLVELGLAAPAPRNRTRRHSLSLDLEQIAKRTPVPAKSGRLARARALAAETIDKIMDPAAPPEERAQRRRRLTKGPTEFREDRVDLPKRKS